MNRAHRINRYLLVLPLLAGLLPGIYQAGRLGLSDIHFSRAELELSFWGRQDYRPQQPRISAANENINAALAAWPENPDYLEVRAHLLMWQAYWEKQPALAARFSHEALALKIRALERRPARRQDWIELAGDKARLGQNDATWKMALEKSGNLDRVDR
jgi:hypothetical protein